MIRLKCLPSKLEVYFKPFRDNIVGVNQTFETPYGQKGLVYADWTASGRLYRPIEEKILNQFGPFVGNTHSETSLVGAAMTQAYRLARDKIKEHVGAGPDDVIVMTGSGMTGAINKFQRLLGLRLPEQWKEKIHLGKADRPIVFVTHLEHHSNQISWLETIAEVVVLEPGADGKVSPEILAQTLKKYKNRKYKFGSFSTCSNVTGIETPVHKLAKVMHEQGGLAFADFSASGSYVQIKMHPVYEKEKLDAVFFSPHKFLGGPGTPGVLIFDSKLYRNLVPDTPGGGTVAWTNPWGGRRYFEDIEIREDGGTPAFLQTIKAALCIELKEQMIIKKMAERKEELLKILFAGLDTIQGIHILASGIRERQGIVSFYFDQIHYNLIAKLLNDRFGIQTRAGCSCAGTYGHYLLGVNQRLSKKITDRINQGDLSTKPGWVRISLHPTNTDEEARYIVEAIKEILKNAKKWEEEYHYDSRTNEFCHKRDHTNLPAEVGRWFNLSNGHDGNGEHHSLTKMEKIKLTIHGIESDNEISGEKLKKSVERARHENGGS